MRDYEELDALQENAFLKDRVKELKIEVENLGIENCELKEEIEGLKDSLAVCTDVTDNFEDLVTNYDFYFNEVMNIFLEMHGKNLYLHNEDYNMEMMRRVLVNIKEM